MKAALSNVQAVAAVEDCTQRLSKYVNFGLLERFLTKRDIGGLSRAHRRPWKTNLSERERE